MNLWTDFATARQRRLQTEFETNNVRIVYAWADEIVDLSYTERCQVRELAVEARKVLSLPRWSSERRQIIAEALLVGLIVIMWVGQLWLFNARPQGDIQKNLLPHPPRGGLNVSLVEQSLFLFIALCLIHLLMRPRVVLENYRQLVTPASSRNPIFACAFTLHAVAVLGGTPWMLFSIVHAHHTWAAGWLMFFSVDLVAVMVGHRAEQALYSLVYGVRRPPWERPHHKMTYYLFLCAAGLDESLPSWEDDIRWNRRRLALAARAIERDRLPLRVVGRFEFALRREVRSDQLRLAAVLRAHGRALAMARNMTDYRRICDSVRAGLLAAVERDWTALLVNAPQVTVGTRLFRYLRRLAPSLSLILFAVGIPLLPGVEPSIGASLRLLLLSTALLALMPIGDATSTTIKGALGQALTPASKER
ncbi:hypothetical protein [Streptomyces sp. NBC_00658]|uniref:hypothetical protein n=1 Tax=Streptomyces sp. NBC_00658 TaxID=2975800 RepID=UPI0032442C61